MLQLIGALSLLKGGGTIKVETNTWVYPTFIKIHDYIEHAGYNWVQREDSLTHTSSTLKNTVYRCLAAKDIIEFLVEQNQDFNCNDLFECIYCLRPYLKSDEIINYKAEIVEFKNFLQELNPDIKLEWN